MTTAEDRITALEAAVEALVDQLQNAPALAAAPSPPPPAPPPPERRAARADTADWTELMDWVAGLTADYSCSAAGVPAFDVQRIIGRCTGLVGHFASPDTRLIDAAMMTAPRGKDSQAWRSAVRRICLDSMSVSET